YLGVRLGDRVQRRRRSRRRGGDARSVRGSGRGPRVRGRRAERVSRQEESARGAPAGGRCRGLGLQAHPRWFPGAGALAPGAGRRRSRLEGRHAARSHRRRVAGPAVRVGGGGGGQVERHSAGARPGGGGDRRGPDVARGRVVPGDPQGAPAGARSGRGGVSFRRVLSVRGWCRRSGPGGGERDHPAGRLGERRRGCGRGRSGGGGDGVHGYPTVQALTGDSRMTDLRAAPPAAGAGDPPYLWAGCVAVIALVLWLTMRWADQPAASRRDHQLVLIVYLLALSATNHLMGLLVAPAVVVYVLGTDPRVLLRPRFLMAALLVAAVGTSVNLFI